MISRRDVEKAIVLGVKVITRTTRGDKDFTLEAVNAGSSAHAKQLMK
jgi:hypothetical protein